MLMDILLLVAITLLPFLELRASIPYGLLSTNLSWTTVFIVCVVANAVLGPLVYLFIDKVLHLFFRIKKIEKLWHKTVEKTQKKIHKYVEKYGWIGGDGFSWRDGVAGSIAAVGSYAIDKWVYPFIRDNMLPKGDPEAYHLNIRFTPDLQRDEFTLKLELRY